MGYRSEVGFCLAAPAQTKLESGLLKIRNGKGRANDEERKLILELFRDATVRKDEASGDAAYHWPRLKWYAQYPDVAFVERFIEELTEDEYLFIRLGDDDDDIEIRGTFWGSPCGMALSRSIVFA